MAIIVGGCCGGPSPLDYKEKICPECGNLTTIRISHSYRNRNKLYYRCDTHRFVDWCLPTNVGTMNPSVEEKSEEKTEMDHDIKTGLTKKPLELIASCKCSNTSSLLFIAVLVIAFAFAFAFVAVTLKCDPINAFHIGFFYIEKLGVHA